MAKWLISNVWWHQEQSKLHPEWRSNWFKEMLRKGIDDAGKILKNVIQNTNGYWKGTVAGNGIWVMDIVAARSESGV